MRWGVFGSGFVGGGVGGISGEGVVWEKRGEGGM